MRGGVSSKDAEMMSKSGLPGIKRRGEAAGTSVKISSPLSVSIWQSRTVQPTPEILITQSSNSPSPKSFQNTVSRCLSCWEADGQENIQTKPSLSPLSHQVSWKPLNNSYFTVFTLCGKAPSVKDKLLRKSKEKNQSNSHSLDWSIGVCQGNFTSPICAS